MGATSDDAVTKMHLRRAVAGDVESVGWLVERFAPLLLAKARLRLPAEFRRFVEPEDLDRELDEPQWDPPVTVGVRIVSVIADCLQHVGQMAYVRGLIENRHWLPY